MTFLALILVLVAAFFHATWNLLAKRVGSEAGSAVFVWLSGSLAVVLYAPLAVAVLVYGEPRLGPPELLFMLGSGVLHFGYFLLLQRGTRWEISPWSTRSRVAPGLCSPPPRR